jgi:hypothetical protein
MASTLDNALKLLGLENADDPALLWQNYMDRLGVLQTELIRATSAASAVGEAGSRLSVIAKRCATQA